MIIRRIKEKIYYIKKDNRGTTFVEMIVCFALLAIFLVCASSLISTITSFYYNIKGEIYSREVSDIVIGKISSEIDGAETFINSSYSGVEPSISADHKTIELYDKTDTYVKLFYDSAPDSKKGLVVQYQGYTHTNNGKEDKENSRKATDWYFDESVYNGFKITDLLFYQGGDSAASPSVDDAKKYGLTGIDMTNYDRNVVLVLLKMDSDRYGEYYFYRFVKMYNIPESTPTPAPPGG